MGNLAGNSFVAAVFMSVLLAVLVKYRRPQTKKTLEESDGVDEILESLI